MKIAPKCIPCLISRVLYESQLSTDDSKTQLKALDAAIRAICSMGFDVPISVLSTQVHRAAYRALGDDDPYRDEKKLANETAFKLLHKVKEIVERSEDKFRKAVIAAIIGNTFDFGVLGFEVDVENFERQVDAIYKHGLDIDDTDEIRKILDNVVYIADNAGEIIYDGLLIEQIKKLGGNVTLVVRGGYILTDATIEDVWEFGLEKIADRVITTGTNAVGLNIEEASKELTEVLPRASLIIAKGMANFEMLSEYSFKPIAYLMMVKCTPVAEAVGARKGDVIAKLVT
ncbi:MAG: ARMT1-like domain-containing protein [Halobacteriota archaeon]